MSSVNLQDEEGFSDSSDDDDEKEGNKGSKRSGSKEGAWVGVWVGVWVCWFHQTRCIARIIFRIVELTPGALGAP